MGLPGVVWAEMHHAARTARPVAGSPILPRSCRYLLLLTVVGNPLGACATLCLAVPVLRLPGFVLRLPGFL